jgi:predicted DNA-binding protein with PD1-like motif
MNALIATPVEALPLRLLPDMDLRAGLESAVAARGCRAAFVASGIGSLRQAHLRWAGAAATDALCGDLEILTLSGTIAVDGSHLHMSVSDAQGRVTGGHVALGCTVRTTVEVLLILLPGWTFTREPDANTGFAEIVMRRN